VEALQDAADAVEATDTARPTIDISLMKGPNRLKTAVKGIVLGSVLKKSSSKRLFVKPDPHPIEKPLTGLLCKEFHSEFIETSHQYVNDLPVERQRDVSRATFAANLAEGERPPTPERLKRVTPPSKTHHDIFPFVFRILLKLQVQLPSIYLSVKQLIVMLELLPDVDYVRVMTIQWVFSRIVDLENFYLVLETVLTLDEKEELYHRLGLLNVSDPMHPDRLVRLDMRRWEHREWCKILVQLAINEPGENWVDASYSWSRYDDHVPGWELPQSWTDPDDEGTDFRQDSGPRRYGWLVVTYRSVGFGCQAIIPVRKALRKRCLVGLKRSL
jgi:hypothetical protein